ncbi:MAG TPA: fenitrothion hydrolase [Solirubrobacteraceae bacterium]|nr:fenitrothion hydrolase [Solirubrobacteraceae bacterium]
MLLLAHSGLSSTKNLPIPEVVFAWAAAAVLVISFAALAVLWPKPKMQGTPPWRPLPLGIGRALGSRFVEIVCGTIGVVLLALIIFAGYAGDEDPVNNFGPTFVMIIFWVGLVFASLLFGDVFRAFNPWRAIGRATGAMLGRRAPTPRPYPEKLGRYPAAFVLLFFTWIELVVHWETVPSRLATAVLGYTVVTLAAQAVWGTETWTRRGEGFSVYYNFISRISVWETRDRVVGLRPPLGGLPRLDPVTGTVAVVAVMIGTVTFDGLQQGSLWNSVAPDIQDVFTSIGIGIVTAEQLTGTLGLLFGVGLVGGFYLMGIEGARTVGGGMTAKRLRRAFIHSLVPIAAVYVIAHYLLYFLYDGQKMKYLISDPLGKGWDLFGTASQGVDYSILTQESAWYVYVVVVVLGHVAGLTLAHDRALALYGQAKEAVRSQYWMLAVMVGFTSLALWLLSQANK